MARRGGGPGGGLAQKRVYSARDYASLLDEPAEIEVDRPAQFVSRITLSAPARGNRTSHVMRAQLLNQLRLNDQDPDVRVSIVRGAGEHFCQGVDVALSRGALPFFTEDSDGQLIRNAVQTWFEIMDLAKPVIAQVHGECLGSGMELAAACDLVYVAEGAQIGYPEGRNMGLPDFQIYPWLCGMRNALSIMLLAETMDGPTAVRRDFANRAFPEAELEAEVLKMADRVARIPADLLAYNKRSVHRAFEAQGMRANLRHGADLSTLMFHSSSGTILTRSAAQGGARLRSQAPSPPAHAAKPAAEPAAKPTPKPSAGAPAAGRPAAGKPAPAAPANRKHSAAQPAAPRAAAAPKSAAPAAAASSTEQQKSAAASVAAESTRVPAAQTEVETPEVRLADHATNSITTGTGGVHVHMHSDVNVHIYETEESDDEDEHAVRSKL